MWPMVGQGGRKARKWLEQWVYIIIILSSRLSFIFPQMKFYAQPDLEKETFGIWG